MKEVHEAVSKFQKELNMLEDENIKGFVHNTLVEAPSSFWKDDNLVLYTRKVFHLVYSLLEDDRVQQPIKDVILAGSLFCDIAYNELKKQGLEDIHDIAAEPYFKNTKEDIQENLFDAVIRIIQAHKGEKRTIRGLDIKPGGPEHIIALAHRLVQKDNLIDIKLP